MPIYIKIAYTTGISTKVFAGRNLNYKIITVTAKTFKFAFSFPNIFYEISITYYYNK